MTLTLLPADQYRFFSRIERRHGGECWPWIGCVTNRGYGLISIGGHPVAPHRLAFEIFCELIPAGLQIDHMCHNGSGCPGGSACLHRRCCNPEHLEAVPGPVNTARGQSPSALNARKTHCGKGHEFTPENTYISGKGGRECRTCRRAWQGRPVRNAP